jgi:thioredoxin-related protein
MKKFLMTLATVGLLSHALAADGEWMTDFNKAKEKAKAENKRILMNFTGSDWCPPCKALHKNVLASGEFGEFAKTNLILVEVDFPTGKKQSDELKKANDELSQKFNIESYPTLIVLDSSGKEMGRNAGYGGEKPKEFIAKIEALKKH